jgi:hypothetical protein
MNIWNGYHSARNSMLMFVGVFFDKRLHIIVTFAIILDSAPLKETHLEILGPMFPKRYLPLHWTRVFRTTTRWSTWKRRAASERRAARSGHPWKFFAK